MTTREAFESIYRSHYKQVYGFAFKLMGTREDALELTQEAFLALYARIDQGRAEGIVDHGKWLLGAARYKAHERWRSRDKQPLLGREDDISQAPQEWSRPPEWNVERQDVRRWLEGRRDDVDVQMLLMFMEGFGSKELAVLFQLTEGSVRKRLQRTREAALGHFRSQEKKKSR